MNAIIENRIYELIPNIVSYLKKNVLNSGVADVTILGAAVINYWIEQGLVSPWERDEVIRLLITYISYAFKNGLSMFIQEELFNIAKEVRGYDDVIFHVI